MATTAPQRTPHVSDAMLEGSAADELWALVSRAMADPSVALLVTDGNRFTYASPAAAALLGVSLDLLMNSPAISPIPPRQLAARRDESPWFLGVRGEGDTFRHVCVQPVSCHLHGAGVIAATLSADSDPDPSHRPSPAGRAVLTLDDAFTVVEVADELASMLGYDPSETLGTVLDELPIHRAYADSFRQMLEQAAASEDREVHWAGPVLHQQGSWRWVQGMAVRRADLPRGRNLEVSIRRVSALAPASTDIERILVNAHCLLWNADVHRDGEGLIWDLRLANEPSSNSLVPLDTAPDRTSAETWHDSKHPDDVPVMHARAADAILSGQPRYSQEFRCIDKFGVVHWLYEDVLVESVADGEWRLTGVCTDITELKLVQLEGERRRRQQASLADLADLALRTTDMASLYPATAQLVANALEVDHVSILDHLPRRRELVVRAITDGTPGDNADVRFPRAGTFADAVMTEGPLLVVEDLSDQPMLVILPGGLGWTPVSAIGASVGNLREGGAVLQVLSSEPREFTPDDLEYVRGAAGILATAQRQHDTRRRETLMVAAMGVLLSATSVDEVIERLPEAIGRSLAAELVLVWQVEDRDSPGVLRGEWRGQPDVGEETLRHAASGLAHGEGIAGIAWRRGSAAWAAALSAREVGPAWEARSVDGFRSATAFSVYVRGEVVYVFEALFRQTWVRERELMDAMDSIGWMVGAFVDRRRQENELRESEMRLSRAQRVAAIGDWDVDVGEQVYWWSDEVYRICGIAPGPDFTPSRGVVTSLIHPDDRARVAASRRAAERDHTSLSIDYRIVRPDGGIRAIHEEGTFVYEGDEAVRAFGTVQDVTARWRAERVQALLYEIAEAALTTEDQDGWLSSVHQSLRSVLNVGGYLVALATPGDAANLRVAYASGNPYASGAWMERLERVLATRQSELLSREAIRDLGNADALENTPSYWVAVPLESHGSGIGVLVLQGGCGSPRFGDDDMDILRYVSGQIATAIDRKRSVDALADRERLYHTLLETLPDGVFTTDLVGITLYCNTPKLAMHGLTKPEDLIGRSALELFAPEDIEQAMIDMGQLLQSGSLRNYQYTLLRADGTRFPCEVCATVLHDEHGAPTGYLGVVRDISDRQASAAALRRSVTRLRAVLDGIPDLMFRIARDGRFVDVIPAKGMGLYVPAQDFIGKHVGAIFHESVDEIMGCVSRALATGETQTLEYVLSRGQIPRHFEARYVKCGEDEVLAIVREITDRRAAEIALRESEQRFRTVFESSPVGMMISDEDGRPIRSNRALRDSLGYSDAELSSLSLHDLIAPEDREASAAAYAELVQGIRADCADTGTYVARDGSEHWCSRAIASIRDGDGRFAFAVVVIEDLTERRQIQLALERFELDRKALLDSVNAILWEADPATLALRYVSRQAERLLGYPIERWLDHFGCWLAVVHPDDRDQIELEYRAHLASGSNHELEYRVISADCSVHWVRNIVAVETADGALTRVRGVMVDCTERRLAEAAVHDLNAELERRITDRTADLSAVVAELERSNADLQNFAYAASHDLQEPLRMVSSYLRLLVRRHGPDLEQSALDYIDFAVDGALRMQRMIDSCLEYSRVGTRGLAFESTDLGETLEGVLTDLSVTIRGSDAIVESDALPVVQADPRQMHQLLANLIANAIKFRGSSQPRIRVSASCQNGVWEITVSDNGIGIAPEYRARIFDMFQRLHTRDEYEGTGIGLAICKRIVERHGGTIWVDSEDGVGSTFHFTLPRDT